MARKRTAPKTPIEEVAEETDENLAEDPTFYDAPAPTEVEKVKAIIAPKEFVATGFYGPDNDTYAEWVRKGRP